MALRINMDELRRYASALVDIRSELEDDSRAVHRELGKLEGVWHDPVHERVNACFGEIDVELKRLFEQMDATTANVKKMIRRYEDYLS